MRRSTCVVVTLVTALVAVGVAACGTRLPDSAFVAAQGGNANGSLQAGASGEAAGGGAGQTPGNVGGQPVSPGGGHDGGSSATGASSGSGASGDSGAGGTGGTGARNGGTGGGGVAANGASDAGVTANTITIGNVTSTSGAFGPEAFGVTQRGLIAYLDALNDRGGVNGRKVTLVTCDDGSEGTHFLACVQKLVEQNHVFAFIGNNSDASASAANYEYTHGVPDVGFPLNNGYYKYPNMFSIYGSPGYPRDAKTVGYQNRVENQTGVYRWFARNLHVAKAAVFYYVIPVSQQAGCFEEHGLQQEGITTVYEGGGGNGNCSGAGENPASPPFDEDVINMRSKGVDNVWDAMDTSANQRLCTAMDRQGFTVKAKVSTIEVYSQSVGTWSAPCRDSVYVAGSSDSFADTSNPMVARFRAEFAKYQPGVVLHQWSLEGWALGYEFEDAVKSMGANVTRKGFMAWLDSFPGPPSGYTFNGLFTPSTYAPTNFSQQSPNCQTIAQWQDSAGTYVPRAGTNYCPVTPWVPTTASDDGS